MAHHTQVESHFLSTGYFTTDKLFQLFKHILNGVAYLFNFCVKISWDLFSGLNEPQRVGQWETVSTWVLGLAPPFPWLNRALAYILFDSTVFSKTEFVTIFKIQRDLLLNPVSLIFLEKWAVLGLLFCTASLALGWPFLGASALHSALWTPLNQLVLLIIRFAWLDASLSLPSLEVGTGH